MLHPSGQTAPNPTFEQVIPPDISYQEFSNEQKYRGPADVVLQEWEAWHQIGKGTRGRVVYDARDR
jgi:hypothetical protein